MTKKKNKKMIDSLIRIAMFITGVVLIISGGVTFGLTTIAGIGLIYAAFGLKPK